MNSITRRTVSHLFTRKIITVTLAAALGSALVGGSIAVAATAPGVGVTCEPLGAHAEGTALDCVATPAGQTWQTKGTRLNPFRVGETATISRYVGAAWKQSYTVRVTGGNPDASADVTIGQSVIDKRTIPAGYRPVSAGVVITLLGTKPAPSAGLQMDFIDAGNTPYPLYAYKRGEVDCSSAFIKQVNEAKLTQNNGTITGNVCTFVAASSVNSSLLMRFAPKSIKKGEPRETWFAFLP